MPNQTNFAFTLNNYTDEDVSALRCLPNRDIKYVVVGFEVGESGTPHLQSFMVCEKRCSSTEARKFLRSVLGHDRCHVEPCKGNSDQNFEYCTKSSNYFECGQRPRRAQKASSTNAERSARAIDQARQGQWDLLEKESPDLLLRHYKTLKLVHAEAVNTKKGLDTINAVLYYGPTGTGKTREAHTLSPYVKDIESDWWDGYESEKVVLFDDITPEWMAKNFQKVLRWCDHYAFKAPVKGSMLTIRPEQIIFTSNYDLDQLLQAVPSGSHDAIRRRVTTKSFEFVTEEDITITDSQITKQLEKMSQLYDD